MLSVGAAASCSSARLGGGRVAADGAATARTRLRRVAAVAQGPARRGGRRLASETPSKRSDSMSTDRPGAERRRAVKATTPSAPTRVRVARARVLLSRPVCCLRLLASARARDFERWVLTILSHRSRNVVRPRAVVPPYARCQVQTKCRQRLRVFSLACWPRTSLVDLQGLPGQPSSPTLAATSAASARAGNKAQWAKRRRT